MQGMIYPRRHRISMGNEATPSRKRMDALCNPVRGSAQIILHRNRPNPRSEGSGRPSMDHETARAGFLRGPKQRGERARIFGHQRLRPLRFDEVELSTMRNDEVDLEPLLVAKKVKLA